MISGTFRNLSTPVFKSSHIVVLDSQASLLNLVFIQSFIHLHLFMARTKQATPLRRDPSSEYFSKAETPSRSARNSDKDLSNGSTTNGHANGTALKDLFPVAQKEAGALQFIIAVGGIYGAL